MLPAFLAGANYVEHAAGWLESGLVACYEKFIVDIEMLRMLQEEFTPLEVDEESLAYGAHQEVGPGGHFLGADAHAGALPRLLLPAAALLHRELRALGAKRRRTTPPPAPPGSGGRRSRGTSSRRWTTASAARWRSSSHAGAPSSVTEIVAVRGYRQRQPFAAGEYATSGGSASGFDSTIVALDTAGGITGWGEMAPLGSFYAPSFAAGARAGLAELAPSLIGAGRRAAAARRRAHGRRAARPPVRQVGDRHGVLGRRRADPRPAAVHGAGRRAGRVGRAVPLDPAGGAGRGRRPGPAASAPRDTGGCRSRSAATRLATPSGWPPCATPSAPDVVLFADANGGWTTPSRAAVRARWPRTSTTCWSSPARRSPSAALVREHCASPMVLDE